MKKASLIGYHLLVSFRQLRNTYPFTNRKIINSITCMNIFLKVKKFRQSPSKTAGIMPKRRMCITVFMNKQVFVLFFFLINPLIFKLLLC
jgi:hypothetical protein